MLENSRFVSTLPYFQLSNRYVELAPVQLSCRVTHIAVGLRQRESFTSAHFFVQRETSPQMNIILIMKATVRGKASRVPLVPVPIPVQEICSLTIAGVVQAYKMLLRRTLGQMRTGRP